MHKYLLLDISRAYIIYAQYQASDNLQSLLKIEDIVQTKEI